MTNDLAALSGAATQGEWRIWREAIKGRSDAVRELIEQVEHTEPLSDALVLLDAGGKCPAVTGCGPTSEANAAFIVALVNAYRSGDLVLIDREGMRVKMAAAMAVSQGADEDDAEIWFPEADAAIAAILGEKP